MGSDWWHTFIVIILLQLCQSMQPLVNTNWLLFPTQSSIAESERFYDELPRHDVLVARLPARL